jgi:hypothetical protein
MNDLAGKKAKGVMKRRKTRNHDKPNPKVTESEDRFASGSWSPLRAGLSVDKKTNKKELWKQWFLRNRRCMYVVIAADARM